jgi:hypothetical protein
MAVSQVFHEGRARASLDQFAAVQQIIPPGACVLTDEVSYTIVADRFFSSTRHCSQMVDGDGTDLALSNGRNGVTGASQVPAVRAVWRHALGTAQYVWLSSRPGDVAARRIAWAPNVWTYFSRHFRRVHAAGVVGYLYRRVGHP